MMLIHDQKSTNILNILENSTSMEVFLEYTRDFIKFWFGTWSFTHQHNLVFRQLKTRQLKENALSFEKDSI